MIVSSKKIAKKYIINNNHSRLASLLDSITKTFDEDEIVFTPFFNLGKATPENLIQFNKLIIDFNKINLSVYKTKYIFRLIKGLLKPIINHLFYLKDFKNFKSNIPKHTTKIFISHFIGQDIVRSNDDLYFGKLVLRNTSIKSGTLILLINHTRTRFVKFKNKQNAISNYPIKILLPRTTKSKKALSIYIKQIKFFIKIFQKASKIPNTDVYKKILTYELAIQQMSQSAFMQNYLLSNVSDVCIRTEAKKLILTFEGHSYETFLARKIAKTLSQIKISVYQFAAVVPSQHSFFKNIELLPRSVDIYVAGESTLNEIIVRTSIDKSRIQILGSCKNIKKSIILKNKTANFTVIFAPEGSLDSFLEFVNLARYCLKQITEIKFILRPHPASHKYKLRIFKELLYDSKNIILSTNSLESDLKSAHLCIYRSSAVGIEGLKYGVIPVHYSSLVNGDIDPIRLADLDHLRIDSPETLVKELNKFSQNANLLKNYNNISLNKVFNKYLAPINKKIDL
jgi:hypothetical protein